MADGAGERTSGVVVLAAAATTGVARLAPPVAGCAESFETEIDGPAIDRCLAARVPVEVDAEPSTDRFAIARPTGTERSTVVPSPSCPDSLSPQHFVVPPASRAHV